jgi:hypothetical protein
VYLELGAPCAACSGTLSFADVEILALNGEVLVIGFRQSI